ncbi:MAG: hypothetical protein ABIQ86_05515 [Steroidobacteraceae bacterium]
MAPGYDAKLMTRTLSRRVAFVAGDPASFVLVSVAVNCLALARSYIAMRSLDYADLGILTILQTVILLVGLLQLGVINGGYRLLCSAGGQERMHINNLVWSVVAVLSVVAVMGAVVAISGAQRSAFLVAVFLGVLAGISTLLRTWMSNQLIAAVKLRQLNQVNLLSTGVSMLPLIFVSASPFLACSISIVAQPLLFVLVLLWRESDMRPTEVCLSLPLLRRVLMAGFIVFLTSVFLLLNSQVERWLIVSQMGVESLGHFYLALLFVTLHALVPSSLDAVFMPRLVTAHARGDYALLRRELRRFMGVTFVYTVLVVALVILLARPVLHWLLPGYIPDLRYVLLLLPGIAVFGLVAPLAIVFNVLIQYRFYFIAYASGTVTTIGLLVGYIKVRGTLDLAGLSIVKSLSYGIIAALIVFGYLRTVARHRELRFF